MQDIEEAPLSAAAPLTWPTCKENRVMKKGPREESGTGHGLDLLFLAAALSSFAGCVGVGAGWAGNWSTPAALGTPGRYGGVDVSVTPVVPTLGYYHYAQGNEKLTATYVTYDLGAFAWSCLGYDLVAGPWWPIWKPVVGRYDWSVSPGGSGRLTGHKLGVGYRWEAGNQLWLLTVEYGWLTLHETGGLGDTRTETVRLALVWIPSLIFH